MERLMMEHNRIVVLGIGNILFTDEGFGIHVVTRLLNTYRFPPRVAVEDGGVLGLNLLGIISGADHLIVVDAIRNRGVPGDLYRLDGASVPARIRAKNSLHQVDFLEALTLTQLFDKVPETIILGVEPQDITTLGTSLTPALQTKVDPVVEMVLDELSKLGVVPEKGDSNDVPCDPLKNSGN